MSARPEAVIPAICIVILLLATPVVWARGSRDRPTPEGTAQQAEDVPLLLAYPSAQVPERMVRERFDLPIAVSLSSWTPFLLETDGRLRYEAGGQYSAARETDRYVDQNGWLIFEYAAVRRNEVPAPTRTVEVRFRVAQLADGDRINQPAAFAVHRVIVESGVARGQVRLLSLRYEGRGRIEAVVGLLE